MKLIYIFIIMFGTGRCLFSGDFGVVKQNSLSLPAVTVLANPEKYKGKCVRIYGVLMEERENFTLWYAPEVIDMGDIASMIRLELDFKVLNQTYETIVKLNGAYVIIEGILDYSTELDGGVTYPLKINSVNRIGFRGRPIMRDELLKKLYHKDGTSSQPSSKTK